MENDRQNDRNDGTDGNDGDGEDDNVVPTTTMRVQEAFFNVDRLTGKIR